MTGLPTITADGTLVGDPELRFTPKGIAVTKFRIACNERRYDNASKGWVDGDATYLTGSCWRDLAEHVAESLSRGDRVLLTGVLRQREWEDKEGKKRTEYEIEATAMGPSLLFASANLHRHTRSTPKGSTDDPWATDAAAETRAAADDDPPF